MVKHIKRAVHAFRKDETGSIAIETMLIIPALFWAYLAMFAIFDSYRHHAINQKAAYTIGDLVSRETTPIDVDYMTGMRDLLKYLSRTANTSDVSIRISSLQYDETQDIYKREWSEVQGGLVQPLSSGSTDNWHARLPILPDKERITVVETFVNYDAPFNTGLSDRTIQNFVFTRPRYAPCVLFDDGSLTSC
ncbi:MAG: hypothetical protein ABJQ34_08685 [Paracoccaceae bacterium]